MMNYSLSPESANSASEKCEAESLTSDADFESLLNSLPVPVSISEKNGKIAFANPAFHQLLKAEGLSNWSLEELFGPAYTKQLVKDAKKVRMVGPMKIQEIISDKSGNRKVYDTWKFPVVLKKRDDLTGTLYLDTTEQSTEQNRLEQLNHQLSKMNHFKSQFVSTVSHEFRTPLSGIFSSVQMIQMNIKSWNQEKLNSMFQNIFDNVYQLKSLLDDVTLLDREQNNSYRFKPVETDLYSLVHQIIEENLTIYGKRSIHVTYSLDTTMQIIDPVIFRYIFTNILSNALKYNVSGKEIQIELLGHSPSEFNLIVQDFGIGIPEEDFHQLFEPFFRASNVGTIKGTGFGLSIIKRFVILHSGKVSIESKEGEGTKVTVTLPYQSEI